MNKQPTGQANLIRMTRIYIDNEEHTHYNSNETS